ncbi:MAG: hypothetical protein IJ677_05495 [Alphaproteobacteria bacterium]|nr:hypothetical protein [Alphaproteobacteria bacterium]
MDFDFAMFRQFADNISDDRNVSARFYDKAVKTTAINENGLPIFKNVTYVEIRLKDNNTEVFNQPASPEKIKRFPREYTLYKMAKEQIKEGTPLEQFAFLTAAEVATCKNRGVFTVEALANLSEDKVKSLGLQNEHKFAEIFMRNAKNNNEVADFARKEREYINKIAEYREKFEIINKENISLKQEVNKLNKIKTLKKLRKHQGE